MTNKVLVLTTYPSADASRRLRIDPLVADLRAGGCDVKVDAVIGEWGFRHKNRHGLWRCMVGALLCVGLVRRLWVLSRVGGDSVVLVHREAFPFFTPHIELWIKRRGARLIVDFDDAMYAEPAHGRDWRRGLRDAKRFDDVLSAADAVFAGSPVLHQHARGRSKEVQLRITMPPPEMLTLARRPCGYPVLLWSGSQSTLDNMAMVLSDTLEVCDDCGAMLYVLGGDNVDTLPRHPRLVAVRWTAELERAVLRFAWIGLMPLADSTWNEGKSAYKLLLYMSAGLTSVASEIGMNTWLAAQAPGIDLVPSLDAWANVLRTVLARGVAAKEGAAARKWMIEHFDHRDELRRCTSRITGSRTTVGSSDT